MADHVHRQILAALATALSGLATSGANVFSERPEAQPLQAAELPALRIYTGPESGTIAEYGALRTRARTLEVVIECCVKAAAAAVDTVDQMCREVEVAIDTTAPLGALGSLIEPRRFEFDIAAEAEQTVAVGRTTYEVRYHTAQVAPDAAL